MELSNREIAVLIWFFVFIQWALRKTEAKKYLIDMIKIILSKSVLLVILVMLTYVSISIWILNKGGLWDLSQTKSSIAWTFSVATLTIFRMNDILKEDGYFKEAVLDNIKIITAIEFIINFHTLSVWIELLLVPVTTLCAMLQAYTSVYDTDDNKIVHNIVTRTLGVIAIWLLSYEIFQIYINPEQFFTKSTLLDFGLPIILSLMFIPFVYFLAVYMLYSHIFVRFGILTNNENSIKYAKKITFKIFSFDVALLREWSRNIHKINYNDIDEIKTMADAVKNGAVPD